MRSLLLASVAARVPAAYRRDVVFLIGELLFVSGWSTMWASSLDLIPHIPISACLVLMAIGLSLPPGYTHRIVASRRRRASVSGRSLQPPAAVTPRPGS